MADKKKKPAYKRHSRVDNENKVIYVYMSGINEKEKAEIKNYLDFGYKLETLKKLPEKQGIGKYEMAFILTYLDSEKKADNYGFESLASKEGYLRALQSFKAKYGKDYLVWRNSLNKTQEEKIHEAGEQRKKALADKKKAEAK